MNGIKNILLLAICFINSVTTAQYISLDHTRTAQQLIENVLVNNLCANVSNFAVNGTNFTAGQNSYGYFSAGTSNFPIKVGILIIPSNSKNAIGSFISDKDAPKIELTDATLYCRDPDGDGVSVSDITKAANIIKNNDPKLAKLVDYKSLTETQNKTNSIKNSMAEKVLLTEEITLK